MSEQRGHSGSASRERCPLNSLTAVISSCTPSIHGVANSKMGKCDNNIKKVFPMHCTPLVHGGIKSRVPE